MVKMARKFQEATLWQALEDVKDPEIPVVSVVEMGIVREIVAEGVGVVVTMTPTFAGCPALLVMQELIEEKLLEVGVGSVVVETTFNPPWTSDWITDEGRRKLKAFGLAPPRRHGGRLNVMTFFDEIACPRCDSLNTKVTSSFGTTLCRTMVVCQSCLEPFEQFKPL